MIGTRLSTTIFVGFVVLMYIVVFRLIKKASWEDRPI